LQQQQRLAQLFLRGLVITGTTRQKTQMEARHGEAGVEIGRHPIVMTRRCTIVRTLPAEREQIMRASAQLVDLEEISAGVLGIRELPPVGEKHGPEQPHVRIEA
jgi:hypothetical protein